MKKFNFWIVAGCCVFASFCALGADLRIGIVGCDTSHAVEFTKIINDETNKNHVPGGKVVVAFKGGSKDIKESWSRVDKIAKQLEETNGIKMVASVEELCKQVDVVLIESVDGRPHLEEARTVIKAGKPFFIDKPVGGSLKDVIKIDKLAREAKVPWFSSSAYRYYDSIIEVKSAKIGDLRSAVSYGPCELESHHPDLYWYGIHPTEGLYTVMGPGCETVVRTATTNTDVITGTWSDGRVGMLIGQRSASGHHVILFGSKGMAEQKSEGDYAPLVREIMKFFQTGVSPVPNAETVELYAFMEAADESKREGGKPVKISYVIKKNGGK